MRSQIFKGERLRALARLFLVAGVTLGLLAGSPAARAAKSLTPVGEVLVASNNVFEAEKPDARKAGDMKRFVSQLLNSTQYAPDLVLVQEVRRVAVTNIRRFLSAQSGRRYEIAVNATVVPWEWVKKFSIILGTDSAILYLPAAMKKLSGGYIKTKHPLRHAVKPAQWKRHAWARFTEKPLPNAQDKPLTMAAVSLHFPRQTNFKTKTLGHRYKKRWSNQIATFLQKRFPRKPYNLHTIAGDFNDFRCVPGSGYAQCNNYPFYNMLVGQWDYRDAIFAVNPRTNPIDFIFSTGGIHGAWWDENNTHNPGAPSFYSNHDTRWGLIGAERG